MRRVLIALLLLVATVSGACRRQPPEAAQWGQNPNIAGQAYQNDHSWFYYWMMWNAFGRSVQPSYTPVFNPAPPPMVNVTPSPTTVPNSVYTGGTAPRTNAPVARSSTPTTSFRSGSSFSSPRPSSSGSSSFRSSSSFSSRPSSSFRSSGSFGRR